MSSKNDRKLSKKSTTSGNSNHSKKHTKSSKGKIHAVIPKSLEKYIPPVNTDIVHPDYWELPNRKTFYNWMMDTFNQYETGNTKRQKPFKTHMENQFEPSNIQRLTRDYLQGESPARGLLFFLGLGVGKTCTAITISEAILTKKEVIVISKASLEPNWVAQIKQCGGDYVRNQNHWVFKSLSGHGAGAGGDGAGGDSDIYNLGEQLGISKSVIKINGGIFLIDFSKPTSNFNELTPPERNKLDLQIDTALDSRFTFIHYDDYRGIWNKIKPGTFDNKIIIVDEVHNLGSIMASHSKNAPIWYEHFMNAVNPKIIFLSGTPIINRIFEITKIFNILRGYMHVLEIRFKVPIDKGIKYDTIMSNLKKNKHIDQIIKNTTKKMIKITMNPDNFVTAPNNKGLIYKPEEAITRDQFRNDIIQLIQQMGYKASIEWVNPAETCFPEDEEKFEQWFYNRELNKLKRIDLIKRRISGLTSYYEYQDKTNYPKLVEVHKVQVPMSEYQFGFYERFRHKEIEEERYVKRRNAKTEDEEEPKSSYRLASRMASSFVFPEETGNPYENKTMEDNMELVEDLNERLSEFDVRLSEAEQMKLQQVKKLIYEGFLKLLDKGKDKYLDMSNGSLAKYSPKYLTILLNIKKQAPHGKILVYSQFLSLIGLNIFALAMQQTGDWAPFRIKKVNKMWELDIKDEDRGKYLYIYYTGNEDKTMRDIYTKIFNSQWENLSSDCEKLVKQIKAIHANNYYGEVIKMIMTTRTGAEGLDLKEVRYIHVQEPHWQPVLIQQVIGRGVRNKSHLKLAPEDRTVEVFIYMATITPDLVRKITYIDVRNDIYKYSNPALADKVNKVVSSDEYLYLTAERKKYIINEFQKLMKETAFDCTLNYKENRLNPDNKNLVCVDYNTKNRDEYLMTPGLDETIENIDLAQEKITTTKYGSFVDKKTGKTYYYEMQPNAEGKMYIFGEELKTRARTPKPVGEIRLINGEWKKAFYKPKSTRRSNKA